VELIELAYTAQIAAFIGLFGYLYAAFRQVRLERKLDRLMSAEVSEDELSEEARGTRYSHRPGQVGGATEWEMLSWDDKMYFMNLEKKLNWGAAASGMVTVMGGIIWGWAEVRYGWEEGLGTFWLVILSALFLLGAGYLAFVHYQRWKRGRADYLKMKGE